MKTKQITAWVAAAVVMSTVFTSCKKDEGGVTLPDIGGYQSSNDVAAANLKAHWNFDGTNNERISGTAPSSAVNASFTTGASGQGQALNLNAGYLQFPAITGINSANSLASFTVSSWVNVKNRKEATGSPASVFFSLARPNEWAGSINLMSETGWYTATNDTLIVKGLLVSKNASGNAVFGDTRNEPKKGGDQAFKGANKWSHIVITYDATTSKFLAYANGKKVNNDEWENKVDGTAPLTSLNIFTPATVMIGAWATNLPGATADAWQKPLTGALDNIRVYNKALSAGDVNSLYQLELAGR